MDENNQNQSQTQQQPASSVRKPAIIIGAVTLLIIAMMAAIFFRTNTSVKPSDAPDAATFYTGTLANKPVLFFKVTGMSMSGQPENPYSGMYVSFDNAAKAKYHMGDTTDFRKLKDTQKLFAFDRYASVDNFKLNEDKTKLMMSFLGGANDNMNYIYQVDLKTKESKKIWENQIFKGQAPYNGGTAYIVDFVFDKYVAFAFLKGDPPPASLPSGVIVKNIQSGAEKNIGAVNEAKISMDDHIVTFKQLGKVKAPCEKPKDPQCFATDTYKLVYGSTGELVSTPLP